MKSAVECGLGSEVVQYFNKQYLLDLRAQIAEIVEVMRMVRYKVNFEARSYK